MSPIWNLSLIFCGVLWTGSALVRAQTAASDGVTQPPSSTASASSESFLNSLAELCAAQTSSVCPAGAQYCGSNDECPASHVCSCVRGCARLQCTLEQGACSPLASPSNGYSIQYSDYTQFGCNQGFTLRGPGQKECRNGVWTPDTQFPLCSADGPTRPHVCDALPCRNSGTCTESPLASRGYVCVCPMGVDGEQCENVWLNKDEYRAVLREVVLLRRELTAMGRRVDTIQARTNVDRRPSGGDSTGTPSPSTTTVPTSTSRQQPATSRARPPPEQLPTTETPVVFRWPEGAVDNVHSTPFSILLKLPLGFGDDTKLLSRAYSLQLQDWSQWQRVSGGGQDGRLCAAPCSPYTVTGLRPLTAYQFTVLLESSDVSTHGLRDLDIVEAATPAEGVPLWPADAVIEQEGSPVSVVIKLAKVSSSHTAQVVYYSARYRQRQLLSSAWGAWKAVDGQIDRERQRMEISAVTKSGQLQVAVSSHLMQPGSLDLLVVESSPLHVQLPQEIYEFLKTSIPSYDIRRTSVLIHLPSVSSHFHVTAMSVFLRHKDRDTDAFVPWTRAVQLPVALKTYRLQNLKPARVYELRVRGRTEQGLLRYSSSLTFATPSNDIPVWGIVALADRTSTSITINLPKVDPAFASSVQYYLVSYHGYGTRSPSGWQPGAGPLLPAVTRAVLSDLQADTRYDIRVQATVAQRGETFSSVFSTRTLAEDAPKWLTKALDHSMARPSSVVVNVPVISNVNVRYMVNMRRWQGRIGLWSESRTVMTFNLSNGIGSRVRSSLADNGRKYIPVRLGPLEPGSYYQFNVQYRYLPGMRLSPESSTRTARTLAAGTPTWTERPVVEATPTTAELRMPNVADDLANSTTHYTVQYRFAAGHTMEDISADWKELGVLFQPHQKLLRMVGLPVGGTVEVRVIAHSPSGPSDPSPVYRVLLPLAERLGESGLRPQATSATPPINAAALAALRPSCARLCCQRARAASCSAPGQFPPNHLCAAYFDAVFCADRFAQCCGSI